MRSGSSLIFLKCTQLFSDPADNRAMKPPLVWHAPRAPRWHVAVLVLLVTTLVPLRGTASMSASQRLSDAQTLLGLIAHRYAPLEWKESHLGLSFEQLAGDLLALVEGEMADEDYFAAMAGFVGSLEDAHTSLIIPSTKTARLGFTVDTVGGEVVIDSIDRRILPVPSFPFVEGDVLVSIDGVPATKARDAMKRYRGLGSDAAEERIFASWLTARSQRLLPHVPGGTAWLVIRSRKAGTQTKIALPWIVEGFGLAKVQGTAVPLASGQEDLLPEEGADGQHPPLERMRRLVADDVAEASGMGKPRPFFPMWPGFEDIKGSPLFAGTFELSGHRIGFLRIPTWSAPNAAQIVAFLANQIPEFDKTTDALVIDQTNNGGGSLCYLEVVTSMFLREPIPKMLFRIRANRTWLMIFEEALGGIPPGNPDAAAVRQIVYALRNAMAHGASLTDPFPLCSVAESLTPAKRAEGTPIAYTKPILLLVNELDASAADVFPALLQDGGRATLLGARTMGAGGNVVKVGPMGNSDFSVRITESLMWRPKAVADGKGGTTNYIENVGVTPDIPYAIGIDDILDGYAGYRAAIEQALLEML